MSFNCFLRNNNASYLLLNYLVYYRWFRENGSFSLLSINENFLSIPYYTGSRRNHFPKTHGTIYSYQYLKNFMHQKNRLV